MTKTPLLWLVAACLGAGGVRAETVEPAPALKQPRCAPATGSRLSSPPTAQGVCQQGSTPMRSYSSEDIERTGQIDLDQALTHLDPAITRGGSGAGSGR